MALPRLALTGLCLLFSLTALADPLWVPLDSAIAASAVTLPDDAIDARPVQVGSGQIADLAEGARFQVTLPDGTLLDYQVEAVTAFLNGDAGLRAVLLDGPADGNYIVSLTASAAEILATIYVPGAKYLLQAQRSGGDYLGYLYREAPSLRLPPDLPRPVLTTRIDAVSSSDVSIKQTLSSDHVLVGDIVEVTVEVTNNSSSTINGETLKVIFILDKSTFVDATAGCIAKSVLYSNGTFKELHCPVNSLSAGGKLTITYRTTISAAATPYVASTVLLDQARDDEFVIALNDVLKDTDNDGISDFNEALLGTNPNSSASGPSQGASAQVDLLLLYTPAYVSDLGSTHAITALNQLIQQTNDMYAVSGTGIVFRPTLYQQLNYTISGGLDGALDAMKNRSGVFADLNYLRAISGADLVVLVNGRNDNDNSCGIAQGSGTDSLGDFSWTDLQGYLSTVYMAGSDLSGNGSCSVDTLAHELGHMFGLNHSRPQGEPGTFPWSLGHGVNNSFHTIMAYDTAYPGAQSLSVFSDPNSSNCKGQPCGVSRMDETNGADAVFSLRTTRFQVARFHGARPTLALTNASGSNTSATASGGVIRTGGSGGPANSFGNSYTNQEILSLAATLNVDPVHVGQTGVTHIVIAAEGLGYFQVNSSGGYVPWDGNPTNLLGTIAPRPLLAAEQLTAFRDLSFNSIGVPAVNLTVFFAYAIQGSSNLVYTSSGVPLNIH